MERLRKYMQTNGIKKVDIPIAVIYFKTLSYMTWFGTLALCYRYRPIMLFTSTNIGKIFKNKLITKYPNGYKKTYNFIMTKSEKLAEWKYFKWIPTSMNLDPTRFSRAIGSNLLVGKLLLPITFPTQIHLVIKYLKH